MYRFEIRSEMIDNFMTLKTIRGDLSTSMGR